MMLPSSKLIGPHQSYQKKRQYPRRIGSLNGNLSSKLHAVCDGSGRPLIMLLSEDLMTDYTGAALLIDTFA